MPPYNQLVSGTLRVKEIYLSLQGESTFAGLPCVFVRLTGCDLRCSYCDTAYAFTGGTVMSLEDIQNEISTQAEGYPNLPTVELTGGEPMLQKETPSLMTALCDAGFTGPHDSVLGRTWEPVVQNFLTSQPHRFPVAKSRVLLQGAVIEVDGATGRAMSIERVSERLNQ